MAEQSIEWPQEPISVYWTSSDLPDNASAPRQFVIFDEDEGGDGFSAGLYDVDTGNQVIQRFLQQAIYKDLDRDISIAAGDMLKSLNTAPLQPDAFRWVHDQESNCVKNLTDPRGEENFIVWKVDPDLKPLEIESMKAGKVGICSCGVPACEMQYALIKGNVCQILFNIVGGELRTVIFFPFCFKGLENTTL